jgi:putative transposase
MQAVERARSELPCVDACSALGLPRATYYRMQARVSSKDPGSESETRPRKHSPRALSDEERRAVLEVLHSPRFVDLAVPQVWATLLDEGRFPCSMRTMYRILDAHGEVRERRDQVRRPNYSKPELVATAPNQVWSWDITKLRGPRKWTYFYLYVLLDIFSRYAVGWMVARCESAALAAQLWAETARKQGIRPGQLTSHADRGSPMISKSLALLYADLGVAQSLSRPHVSDDNPYSEAQFKTLKYHPTFPDRFGCQEDARAWCARFFAWYNGEHRHSSLGWMTPADVHHGRAALVHESRSRVLDASYALHPERFSRRRPTPPPLPTAAWINPPAATSTAGAVH